MTDHAPIERWTITLSRATGSLSADTAALVGQKLGFRIVRQELITAAARQSGHPEVALAAVDDLGLLNICPTPSACQAYQQALAELMQTEAQQGGCIIIGRAGQVILRAAQYTLRVRLTAPLDIRVQRIAERQKITHDQARQQVKVIDHNRQYYVRRYYHSHWDDPNQYDLVVNTEHLTAAQAAEIICYTLQIRAAV